jgi:hypothetical protein
VAATASTHSPAAALRSHRPVRSWPERAHSGPDSLPVPRPRGTDGRGQADQQERNAGYHWTAAGIYS